MSVEKENIVPAASGGAVVEKDLQLLSYLPKSDLCSRFSAVVKPVDVSMDPGSQKQLPAISDKLLITIGKEITEIAS